MMWVSIPIFLTVFEITSLAHGRLRWSYVMFHYWQTEEHLWSNTKFHYYVEINLGTHVLLSHCDNHMGTLW